MWQLFKTCAFILDERNRLSRIVAYGCVFTAGMLAWAALDSPSAVAWSLGGLTVACLVLAWGSILLGNWWSRPHP